jgi:hypothetical protein
MTSTTINKDIIITIIIIITQGTIIQVKVPVAAAQMNPVEAVGVHMHRTVTVTVVTALYHKPTASGTCTVHPYQKEWFVVFYSKRLANDRIWILWHVHSLLKKIQVGLRLTDFKL